MDIIQLLPDNIANQIAAGEVIQRPASAVKELLENAVDAGATDIKLLVNDAGKALIQVIDNGKGMSETDARMCFERHATSKIKSIDDLFAIKTMGFRGEALASIAAVAQVELKTKRAEDEFGTFLEIENSAVTKQEPVAFNNGTSIAMKNLFFNIPARRNFLKSNTAELKHIIDEFIRVAMAFPEVAFSLSCNANIVYALEVGTLKQRIVQILGNSYNAKVVAVQENTDYLNIYGFVGKPETAKKTRGDQYFFVNNRFIKSAYLNHAVVSAFSEMIAKDSFPMYCLFIDLDPAQVDVNVHPTKQEIKFEDEKIVYAFVNSAVKHALAQYSVMPTLDFELDPGIQHLDAVAKPFGETQKVAAQDSILYSGFTKSGQAHLIEANKSFGTGGNTGAGSSGFKPFTSILNSPESYQSNQTDLDTIKQQHSFELPVTPIVSACFQIHQTYIVTATQQGYWLIHQQNAHERVLYEKFAHAFEGKAIATQQSLFPSTIEFSAADAVLIAELMPDLKQLGFMMEPFGNNTFVVHGTPADVLQGNEKDALEKMLEQVKHFSSSVKFSKRELLLRTLSLQHAIKAGTILSQQEMQNLVADLLHCGIPNSTPNGKPTFMPFSTLELSKQFGR